MLISIKLLLFNLNVFPQTLSKQKNNELKTNHPLKSTYQCVTKIRTLFLKLSAMLRGSVAVSP